MATKKKANGNKRAWEIGAGITAAAIAAAASAYVLSDEKTKKKAKAWISKAKIEIAKHAKTAKKLGEKEYSRLVEQAVKKYGSLENITAADVMKASKELKAQWVHIQKQAQMMAKGATKKPAAKKKSAHTSKPASKTKKKSSLK